MTTSDGNVSMDSELVEDALAQLEDAQKHGKRALSHEEVRPSTALTAERAKDAYKLLVNAHPDYELTND